jgi:hypothetical protein
MPPLFRRFGRPGLLGAVARTAVVAGTATVTARAINRGMSNRQTERDEAAAYEAEMTQPMPPPAAQASGVQSLTDQLESLSALNASGAITDQEFATAKGRLLGA